MSRLVVHTLALVTEPSPNPTEGALRPGLEEWQVSPGLIGFVVTFALAVACVLLFLNMTKHLRRTGHNAREQGLPVRVPEVIGFRRPGDDGTTTDGSKSPDTTRGGSPGNDDDGPGD